MGGPCSPWHLLVHFKFHFCCGHFLLHQSQFTDDQWWPVCILSISKNNSLNKVLSRLTSLHVDKRNSQQRAKLLQHKNMNVNVGHQWHNIYTRGLLTFLSCCKGAKQLLCEISTASASSLMFQPMNPAVIDSASDFTSRGNDSVCVFANACRWYLHDYWAHTTHAVSSSGFWSCPIIITCQPSRREE